MSEEKTMYDLMRQSDYSEEDAMYPEDVLANRKTTERDRYFEFYDDIKTSIKEDW